MISIALLLFTIMHEINQNQTKIGANNVLTYMYTHLNADPIVSISSYRDKCPSNFKQIAIGEWSGISAGCLCSDGSVHKQSYCYSGTQPGCELVQHKEQRELYYWKKQIYCAKYGNDGKLGGLILVPNSSKHICVNTDYQPAFKSRQVYPLQQIPEIGCDEYGGDDQNYKYIDSYNANKLYSENDIKLDELPYYQQYTNSNDDLSLMESYIIQLSEECKQIKQVKQIIIYFKVKIELLFTFLIVVMLQIVILVLYYFRMDSKIRIVTQLNHTKLVILISMVILSIVTLYFSTYLYKIQKLLQFKEYLEQLQNHNCISVHGINLAMNELVTQIQSSYDSNIHQLKTCLMVTILYFVVMVILYYKKRQSSYKFMNNPW